MSGIDINLLSDLLICNICLDILDNAVNSNCRHSFCRSCVKQWIDSNHSDCPKCKTQFGRKRANEDIEDNQSVLIGDYVFGRDFTANQMRHLKVKCRFAHNGCPEEPELGSLESHIKNCEHKICMTCELPAQPLSPHNCIELMKNEIKEFKDKTNRRIALMGRELQNSVKRKQKLEVMYEKLVSYKRVLIKQANTQQIDFCLEFKLFLGTYKFHPRLLELTPDGINVGFMSANSEVGHEYQDLIRFWEISEILYCCDPLFPVLIIKPKPESCLKIKETLDLSEDSQNGYQFDANSEDERHRYIIAIMERGDQEFVVSVLGNCRPNEHRIKCRNINYETTRQMIQRLTTTAVHHSDD